MTVYRCVKLSNQQDLALSRRTVRRNEGTGALVRSLRVELDEEDGTTSTLDFARLLSRLPHLRHLALPMEAELTWAIRSSAYIVELPLLEALELVPPAANVLACPLIETAGWPDDLDGLGRRFLCLNDPIRRQKVREEKVHWVTLLSRIMKRGPALNKLKGDEAPETKLCIRDGYGVSISGSEVDEEERSEASGLKDSEKDESDDA
ncbi:hypothetical protein JCM10213v2_007372 [Rhodosporidiobolus nylandii]